MVIEYLNVFFAVIGLAINASLQVAIFRCFPRIGLLRSVFAGFSIGAFSILLFELYVFLVHPAPLRDIIGMIAVNLATYVSLSYCYFHFINLGRTARRIRILRELFNAKAGLSLDEILQRYNAKEIVERRISRLVGNGQIIFKDDRYHIGSSVMLWMAKLLIALKFILLGKKSEFD